MNEISAIIIAKNEEDKIERAVKSIQFCNEVIVVDDESTDKTRERAEKGGAKVLIHAKNNDFGAQRNWAMGKAKNEWILFIDADEQVTENLKLQISNLKFQKGVTAYAIPRRDFFWGHEMRYGETKQARTKGIIRLVKKESGIWAGSVHETFIPSGSVGKLDEFLNHYAHDSLSSFVQDINIYSSLRASELDKIGKKVNPLELIFLPFGKFIYTYFILLGFLDGPSGFVYSFIMSFHSFLVRAKLATKSYV